MKEEEEIISKEKNKTFNFISLFESRTWLSLSLSLAQFFPAYKPYDKYRNPFVSETNTKDIGWRGRDREKERNKKEGQKYRPLSCDKAAIYLFLFFNFSFIVFYFAVWPIDRIFFFKVNFFLFFIGIKCAMCICINRNEWSQSSAKNWLLFFVTLFE